MALHLPRDRCVFRVMLKITVHTDSTTTVFELEGKLVGPWVGELGGCWRKATLTPDSAVRVILKSVTFIDIDGRNLLREMHLGGAELVAEGCMNKAILDDIASAKNQRN